MFSALQTFVVEGSTEKNDIKLVPLQRSRIALMTSLLALNILYLPDIPSQRGYVLKVEAMVDSLLGLASIRYCPLLL